MNKLQYSDKVSGFFLDALLEVEQGFDMIAKYKQESGIFQSLFTKYKSNSISFWTGAKLEYGNDGPDFILNLLNLSCYLPEFEHVDKIYQLSREIREDLDENMKQMKMQTIIERFIP